MCLEGEPPPPHPLALSHTHCSASLCDENSSCETQQPQNEPAVFQFRSHLWSQDLMTFRFLMSCCRKNSVRGKVIGKKWVYLDRNTLHR